MIVDDASVLNPSKINWYCQWASAARVSKNQSSNTGEPGLYFKGGHVWVCVPPDRSKIILWQSDDDVNTFYMVGYFPAACREYKALLNKWESAYVAAAGRRVNNFYRRHFNRVY